jgi:hypothetical protein
MDAVAKVLMAIGRVIAAFPGLSTIVLTLGAVFLVAWVVR